MTMFASNLEGPIGNKQVHFLLFFSGFNLGLGVPNHIEIKCILFEITNFRAWAC